MTFTVRQRAEIRALIREELQAVAPSPLPSEDTALTPAGYRVRRGLSMAGLADASGVETCCVRAYEHGERKRFSAKVLNRLADALGVSRHQYREACYRVSRKFTDELRLRASA